MANVSTRVSLPSRNSIKATKSPEKLNLSLDGMDPKKTFQGQEMEKLKAKLLNAEKELESQKIHINKLSKESQKQASKINELASAKSIAETEISKIKKESIAH